VCPVATSLSVYFFELAKESAERRAVLREVTTNANKVLDMAGGILQWAGQAVGIPIKWETTTNRTADVEVPSDDDSDEDTPKWDPSIFVTLLADKQIIVEPEPEPEPEQAKAPEPTTEPAKVQEPDHVAITIPSQVIEPSQSEPQPEPQSQLRRRGRSTSSNSSSSSDVPGLRRRRL